MVDSKDHFEEFEPHTLLKHAILRMYAERWARKLLLRRGAGTRLRIVDACAGRGGDEAGNKGSPLVAAVVAKGAAAQISEMRGEPVRIEVAAIEQKPSFYRALQQNLEPFGDSVVALPGTLADHIGKFEREFDEVPTLFFIDPFGLAPLRADVVGRALAGRRNEVLLLFADQAALRHNGAAATAAPRELSPQASMFDDEPVPAATYEPAASVAGRVRGAQRSTEILDAAYGHLDWRAAVRDVPQQERRRAFIDLYVRLLHELGAEYVLVIPIINDRFNLQYHLVHASHSVYGYTTMKEEVERAWKAGTVGDTAATLMRFGAAVSNGEIERAVRTRFAGREVGWTEENGVQDYAMKHTPALKHQMPELKRRLADLRVPGRGREIRYKFPPLPKG
ncbi:MAG: three-Cys-motif partner protein TcmP [Gemmatimonadota bacterium]